MAKFTFAHFIEPDTLADRVAELATKYTAEEIAATAFFLGRISLGTVVSTFPGFGDFHVGMHVFANVFASEWLTDLVNSGVIDPKSAYDMLLRDYGELLEMPDGQVEAKQDDVEPMSEERFKSLWGPYQA